MEQDEWIDVLKKKVENFKNILKRGLEQVPLENVEQKKKI